ncbi:MAG TPA: hypothetical protein VFJ16_18905 [Longimicrobium sp.]|nr:hypothetical protein [Longimicrobium sp.]
MSTNETEAVESHRPAPSNPHGTARGKSGDHEYHLSFYPGFASGISVNGTDIYRQGKDDRFVLPAGTERPWSSHAVEIKSPTKGYTVVLHVDDPDHVVDRIEMRLRDPGTQASAGGGVFAAQQTGDTVVIDNSAMTCPPNCR